MNNKISNLFEVLLNSKSENDYLYNFSEIIDFFILEYKSENEFKSLQKIEKKVALFYCSIYLNIAEEKSIFDHILSGNFLMGRILLELGVPVHSHIYLKKAEYLCKEKGYDDYKEIVDNHIKAVEEKYHSHIERFDMFSGFKDKERIDWVEFNDFNELYEDAISYIEGSVIFDLSIEENYQAVYKNIDFIVNNKIKTNNINKDKEFLRILFRIIDLLLSKKHKKEAVILILSLGNDIRSIDFFKEKFKPLISSYLLPSFIFDNKVDTEEVIEYLSKIEMKDSIILSISSLSSEYFIAASLIYSLRAFFDMFTSLFDCKDSKGIQYHLLNSYILSISNCTVLRKCSVGRVVDNPDDCLIDITEYLEKYSNNINKNSKLYNYIKSTIYAMKASTYLSRSISADYAAKETRHSMADRAREDEDIAIKLSISDYELGIAYAERSLQELLEVYNINKLCIDLSLFEDTQLPIYRSQKDGKTINLKGVSGSDLKNILNRAMGIPEENYKTVKFDFSLMDSLFRSGLSDLYLTKEQNVIFNKTIDMYINKENSSLLATAYFLKNILDKNPNK